MATRVISTADELPALCDRLVAAPHAQIDLETTALRPRDGRIRTIQLGLDDDQYVVDLWATGGPGPLRQAVQDYAGIWLAHNAKFEVGWLTHHWGISFRDAKIFDTMHASKWLHNGRGKVKYKQDGERYWEEWSHGLYDVIARELGITPDVPDLQRGPWDGELTRGHIEYAAFDVRWMAQLRDVLRARILSEGLGSTMLTEMQAIAPVAEIELAGMAVDVEAYRMVVAAELQAADESRRSLIGMLPNPMRQANLFGEEPWNPDSPQQLLVAFRQAGIDVSGTSKKHLKTWDFTHPVTKALLTYRKHSTRAKMFGESWLAYVSDGRVYGDYWAALETGRFSVRKPNTTQLPRDKAYRSCFRAPAGRQLVIADYAQIELRIAAEIAQDKVMLSSIREGKDLHIVTAAALAHIPYDQVTKELKQQAKAVNFGLLYKMGAKKLKEYSAIQFDAWLSDEQAREYHRIYHTELYQGINAWHRESDRQLRRGEVRTLGGRRRFLDPNYHYNESANTPVQGTGADILKTAIRLLYDRTKGIDTRIVVTPHDEIVSECAEDAAETVARLTSECMVEAARKYLRLVPVKADADICSNWSEKG